LQYDSQHEPVDFFSAAARFYHFRPAYPAAAINWIADALHLDGRGRMLDVGCGTGHVCLRFAGRFAEIIGLDPSRPMLNEAAELKPPGSPTKFQFRQLRAEDLPADLGLFRLITFGASFHRVNQPLVTELVYRMLESQGGLALLFPAVPWSGDQPWKAVFCRTVEKWTGAVLNAPFEPSQNLIARSSFGVPEVRDFQEEHFWSIPELFGFLLSTSFCSTAVLGTRRPAFESDLAANLLAAQPDGRFPDRLETTIVLARKN
jgi:ubiquinone/menaquinone biosynthesis C-methylase UbiE